MSALPGGSADKAGNQYEHWWTALRIADVLEGTASRVRLEPPGDVGVGAEFTVELDGTTWAEQVKDAASGGTWTINRLLAENVLSAAKRHIEAGRQFRFVASTASALSGLSARSIGSETMHEFRGQINADHAADFQTIADQWSVTPEQALVLLRKIDVVHHTNNSLRQLVRSRFQLLVAGDPEVVIATLREYCDDHLQQTLMAPAIWAHLDAKGFKRRHIVGDQNTVDRLHKTVERQQSRVDAATSTMGLVPRADVGSLVDQLRDPAGRQVIVLDGRAGYGKSTVVAHVAAELERLGWFVVVARMDAVEAITNTSDKLGVSIGLTETPVVLLAGAADGGPALLVIDQLDAVSSYSGRMADNFESVAETLRELAGFANVKALLVVRTVDLEADPRLRRLIAGPSGAGRHTLGLLPIDDVRTVLATANIKIPTHEPTLEVLRTPLHLAVFTRLSEAGQALAYRTLQDLYERYTADVRSRIADRVGYVDWQVVTGRLVSYMSDNELLVAPAVLLDAVEPTHVQALVSESVLTSQASTYAFFHESYFDYLFARSFVGAGRDLHEFLAGSAQVLFRRAQTRQVLEHLAATDRASFRSTTANLLTSDHIRFHLKVVVVEVLGQYDATAHDWQSLNPIAFSGSTIGDRVRGLLGLPAWFDAADELGMWEQWLTDSRLTDLVYHGLALAARERPQRAAELIRPHVGESEEWRSRIRGLIEWSINPGLTDLIIEMLEAGQLDDATGRVAVNSDFWSLVYRVHSSSPTDAIRVTGAYLKRSVARAHAGGVADPFDTEFLSQHSQSDGVFDDMRQADPAALVTELLPFVVTVAMANQRERDHLLPAGRRWEYRHIDTGSTVDDAIFNAVDAALRDVATRGPERVHRALDVLRNAKSDELRFLACRTLAIGGPADVAIGWLLEDPTNLTLGWTDSPRWATRELIEAWSPTCSQEQYEKLEAALLAYVNPYETRPSAGYGRYELLSALNPTRMSADAKRKLSELTRRFDNHAPAGPAQVEAAWVGPPIDDVASEKMSDDNWLRALAKHDGDGLRWVNGELVGGAQELAEVLGRRTGEDPERFARLGLKLTKTVPAAALNRIIGNLPGTIDPDLLADLCEHARELHGEEIGRSICQTVATTTKPTERLAKLVLSCANDNDPARKLTPTGSGIPNDFTGDLLHEGLNSTRGQAALAAARILFGTDEFTDTLRSTVRALATDPILAVRTCAAEAVMAMLNRDPAFGLDLGEQLFDGPIEVLDARRIERLLTYLIRRAPERFASTLARGLLGSESVASRAGAIWAVSLLNDGVSAGLPQSVPELAPAARRGAAKVFQVNVADAQTHLIALFDDDDREVRRQAARAMRHLDELEVGHADLLVRAFMYSQSFAEHFDQLLDALDGMTATLPDVAIEVCERAVEAAGADIGDIRTAQAMAGPQITTIVLRLYRQAQPGLRSRCLDLIDRLTAVAAYGVAQALAEER